MQPIRTRSPSLLVKLALVVSLFAVGCGGSANTDCRGRCDTARVNCRQRCTDDACRSQCDVDLNNCTVSCTSVQSDAGH